MASLTWIRRESSMNFSLIGWLPTKKIENGIRTVTDTSSSCSRVDGGEKLSQSKTDDDFLTQLLDSGFFHAE
jgi:hypothetical protein